MLSANGSTFSWAILQIEKDSCRSTLHTPSPFILISCLLLSSSFVSPDRYVERLANFTLVQNEVYRLTRNTSERGSGIHAKALFMSHACSSVAKIATLSVVEVQKIFT